MIATDIRVGENCDRRRRIDLALGRLDEVVEGALVTLDLDLQWINRRLDLHIGDVRRELQVYRALLKRAGPQAPVDLRHGVLRRDAGERYAASAAALHHIVIV